MIVCMSATKSWYHYLEVAIYSLLSKNKVRKLYLFLETDDFEKKDLFEKEFNVEIIIFNYKKIIDKYFLKENKNRYTYYSEATLIRLIFSKVIDEDKVLYIDTDAIVLDDISDLWNIDLKDNYIAGVLDKNITRFIDYLDLNDLPEDYINAGIILMNLKLLKEEKIDDKLLKEINKKEYRFPDQDVINKICKGKILFIDNMYNSSIYTDYAKEIKILHYIGPKTNWVEILPFANIWYEWEEKYNNFIENK